MRIYIAEKITIFVQKKMNFRKRRMYDVRAR